jgi:hypothetical protein
MLQKLTLRVSRRFFSIVDGAEGPFFPHGKKGPNEPLLLYYDLLDKTLIGVLHID